VLKIETMYGDSLFTICSNISLHKVFIEFWLMDNKYTLKNFRFYELDDNHPFKFNEKLIELNKGSCYCNDIVGITNSVLDMNEDLCGITPDKNGLQSQSAIYNKWIVPPEINPKNSYVTFTPDFFIIDQNSPNHYMFKQTQGITSFPHGSSSGGR